jgi:hypothetical protein
MTTLSNPRLSMSIRHSSGIYPQSPLSCGVEVHAQHCGLYGWSKDRPLLEMPKELLTADLETFMGHPWVAPMIEEAKTDLVARFKEMIQAAEA